MRFVVRKVHGRLYDGAQTGARARRMFRRGGRQHAAAVDAEQGAEEHPGAGRVFREDQTEDFVRRDRPSGRVRVLRYKHGRRHEDQVELFARRRGRDAVQFAHVGRMFRQVPSRQEARRRSFRCLSGGTLQQRHHIAVFDRGWHDGGRFGRRTCRTGEAKTPVRRRWRQKQ